MRMRDTLRAARRHAAARKRIRLGQLEGRYRFRHRLAFDDFWAEQLLDIDIGGTDLAGTDIDAAALVERGVDRAGAAALEAGRA